MIIPSPDKTVRKNRAAIIALKKDENNQGNGRAVPASKYQTPSAVTTWNARAMMLIKTAFFVKCQLGCQAGIVDMRATITRPL